MIQIHDDILEEFDDDDIQVIKRYIDGYNSGRPLPFFDNNELDAVYQYLEHCQLMSDDADEELVRLKEHIVEGMLRQMPNDEVALLHKADCVAETDPKKALKMLEQLLESNPQTEIVLRMLDLLASKDNSKATIASDYALSHPQYHDRTPNAYTLKSIALLHKYLNLILSDADAASLEHFFEYTMPTLNHVMALQELHWIYENIKDDSTDYDFKQAGIALCFAVKTFIRFYMNCDNVYEESLQIVRSLLDRHVENIDAWQLLVDLYDALDRLEDAFEALHYIDLLQQQEQQQTAENSNDPTSVCHMRRLELLLDYTECLLDMKRPKEAMEYMQQFLKENDGSIVAPRDDVATWIWRIGRPLRMSDLPSAELLLAQCYEDLEQYHEAMTHFRHIATVPESAVNELCDERIEGYLGLARCNDSLKHYTIALNNLRRAAVLNRTYDIDEYHYNICTLQAEIYMAMSEAVENPEESIQCCHNAAKAYESLVRMNLDDADSNVHLAMIYLQAGQLIALERALLRARKTEPDYPMLDLLFAMLYFKKGEQSKAVAYFCKAQQHDSDAKKIFLEAIPEAKPFLDSIEQ